jgi:hypothetical protein
MHLISVQPFADELDGGAHGDDDYDLNWFREDRAADDDVGLKLFYEHSTTLIALGASVIESKSGRPLGNLRRMKTL